MQMYLCLDKTRIVTKIVTKGYTHKKTLFVGENSLARLELLLLMTLTRAGLYTSPFLERLDLKIKIIPQ